jgi:hypothetical protein
VLDDGHPRPATLGPTKGKSLGHGLLKFIALCRGELGTGSAMPQANQDHSVRYLDGNVFKKYWGYQRTCEPRKFNPVPNLAVRNNEGRFIDFSSDCTGFSGVANSVRIQSRLQTQSI